MVNLTEKSIINKIDCELNKWIESTGSISNVSNAFMSILFDYIPYDATKQITIKYTKNFDTSVYTYFFGVSYYDINKEFIDRGNAQASGSNPSLTQQLRENGAYIRPQFQVRPKPEGIETTNDFIDYFGVSVIDSDGTDLLLNYTNPQYESTSAIDYTARQQIDNINTKVSSIDNFYIDENNLFSLKDEIFANELANKINSDQDPIILTKSDLTFDYIYTNQYPSLVSSSNNTRISTRIKYNGGYKYLYVVEPWVGDTKDEVNDMTMKLAFIDKNISRELGHYNTWSLKNKYIQTKIPDETYYIEFCFAINPVGAVATEGETFVSTSITVDDIPDDFQIILSKSEIIYNLFNKLNFIDGHNLTANDTVGTTTGVAYCPDYINVSEGAKLFLSDFKYGIRINFYNNGVFVESRNDGIIPYYTIPSGVNQIRVQCWSAKGEYVNNIYLIYLYKDTPLDSKETYLALNPVIDNSESESSYQNPLLHHRFYGKRLSILGDSISTFSNAGTNGTSPAGNPYTYPGNRCRYPQDNLFTEVEDCYWYKLMQHYNMTLGINESWAGSKVICTSSTNSGDNGPDRCISSTTRIGHLGENGSPDVILVYAGTNDAGGNVTVGSFDYTDPKNYSQETIDALGNTDNFAQAYRTMLIRLLKAYPYATIVCMLINYTTSYYTSDKTDAYNEIIKEACDYFGVQWLDLRTAGVNIYNKSTYLPDGVHPNAAGADLIYKALINQLDYLYAY